MIDRSQIPNPFDADVVFDPDRPLPVDVTRIHQNAFDLCCKAYERVAGEQGSWSVLLFGEAGCGKTHLLSRFRTWLDSEMDLKPTKLAALFVAVRMETGPGTIWRHLRRRFAYELFQQKSNGYTRLDAILDSFAASGGGNLTEAFENASDQDFSHELTRVLETYAAGTHRRLCRAWLRGDGISENDLKALNLPLPPTDSTDEDWAESDARYVIEAITRLCAPAPVVFCFDQIEALGLSQQKSSYGFFSQMGASLINETTNSLVISTVSADFLRDLQDGSRLADFHRISKDRSSLHPLDWDLGKQLVEARLALAPEAAQENPIPDADLREFFQSQHGRSTPRSLIHAARRLFARWQDGSVVVVPSIEDFLSGEFERLWNEAEVRSNPSISGAALAHGLPIALQLLG